MRNAVGIFWKVFFAGVAAFIIFLALIDWGVFGPLPSLKDLENPSIMLASEVYADDGTLMGKYYKDKSNRSNVEYKDISKKRHQRIACHGRQTFLRTLGH